MAIQDNINRALGTIGQLGSLMLQKQTADNTQSISETNIDNLRIEDEKSLESDIKKDKSYNVDKPMGFTMNDLNNELRKKQDLYKIIQKKNEERRNMRLSDMLKESNTIHINDLMRKLSDENGEK